MAAISSSACSDRVVLLARRGIHSIARAIALEGLGERGRRRDRIPGADGRPAIDRAERGGGVAVDQDLVAHRVGSPHPYRKRAVEARQRLVGADLERPAVRVEQSLLALELLGDELLHHGKIDVEQRRERPDIDDVLIKLALPRIGIFGGADLGQRHAEHGQIVAQHRGRHRPGRVVEEIAARLDRRDVLGEGLRIHRHQYVGPAAGAQPSLLADPHLVPGRQALNVRGEDVARGDRHAHAHDRTREQEIGACRSRAVDVGEANDEVVYGVDRHECPAWAISMVNFIMSQAPVGQRSAHRPQCRQRSSSLAMTRWVLTGSET